MRVPLSWLREYVEFEATPEELARRLAVSALEVDRILDLGPPDVDGNLGRFLVGRVVEAGKHPNADRLQLCRVDVGEAEPRQIVCGAWNFGAGATVAVGLPGALLPGADEPLREAKLRGEASSGMILSERELQLGTDHTGILVLEDGPEPGTPLADVLAIHEHVLEVTPTMNRVDLLSVYGIAREVAALFDGTLRPMPGDDPPLLRPELVEIEVDDPEGCPRYVGRVFRNVRVGPSPAWLRARLHAADLRAISNVVDVTNYVMHALGNPLHAFDRAKLADGRIVVRRAREGEELRTLDGQLRRLDPRDLMIADAERSVALAAIMGGLETEVSEETTEVLLEAANFEPIAILRSSERLGLRTAGSNRWEKGVDPHLALPAAVYASQLLVELAGAELTGSADVHGDLPARPVVRLRPERTDRLLGLAVPADEQRTILTRLGFETDESWDVTVPTWRARDVTREVDVVEEVARVVLERVPFTRPLRRHVQGRLTLEQRLRRVVEDVLVGAGFSEAYTWSLQPDDPSPAAIRLPDPMTSDQAVLRTTLLPGLVEAARTNVDAGNEAIALFEIARVYLPGGEQLPDERWHVGAIAEGGFSAAKGAVEAVYGALHLELEVRRTSHALLHPGKAAETDAGVLGELHPAELEGDWGVLELDLATLFAPVPERIVYEDVVTYPALRQDIAVVVDEDVEAGALVRAAREAAGPQLREVRVFDVYRGAQVGAGRKSVAIHLAFQSPERTLSDDDAAGLRARIVAALAERFGGELRA
ncbi:MAG TPA: phenylalanine--tRNA ligase subunit beta [Gaiellaceae bacterium]|nr:phenylalanine--tRNA ligase subunit beta [Gaiellaceae bacterium]